MIKRGSLRRTARLLGMLALLMTLMCLNVRAETKTVSMKAGNSGKSASVSFAGKKYDYVFCQVKLTKGGIIRVTGNRITKKGSRLNTSYRLLGEKKERIDPCSINKVNEAQGLSHYHVVRPGTYYFRVKGGKTGTTTLKLQYMITAGVTGGAGRNKAAVMSAGKAVAGVISSHPVRQDRWYKFYHSGGTCHLLAMTNGGSGRVYFDVAGPDNLTGNIWIDPAEYGQYSYTLDISGNKGWYYVRARKDISAAGKYSSAEYALKWYY